jgi:hypothetical protein
MNNVFKPKVIQNKVKITFTKLAFVFSDRLKSYPMTFSKFTIRLLINAVFY